MCMSGGGGVDMSNLPLSGGGQPDMEALGQPGGKLFEGMNSSGKGGINWGEKAQKFGQGMFKQGNPFEQQQIQATPFHFSPLSDPSADTGSPGPFTASILAQLVRDYGGQ